MYNNRMKNQTISVNVDFINKCFVDINKWLIYIK